jgi:hypothetical protein
MCKVIPDPGNIIGMSDRNERANQGKFLLKYRLQRKNGSLRKNLSFSSKKILYR